MANKFLSSLVAGRQRQANAFVNSYLLTLDDETLARNGFNRKDLAVKKANSRNGL
ncbi:MAG: hypothetical protein ABJM86_00635 [Hyphomicrobiales bacterium]